MSMTLEDLKTLKQKYKQLGEEIERLKKEQKSSIPVKLERGMLFQFHDHRSPFDGLVYLLSQVSGNPQDLRLIYITDGLVWSDTSIFGRYREHFKYLGMAKDLMNIEIK